MAYYDKYIKYKKKYILLQNKQNLDPNLSFNKVMKKQYSKTFSNNKNIFEEHGGVIKENDILYGWKAIKNFGQHNCGIFINDDEPDKIIKCEYGNKCSEKFNMVNIINKQMQLFPIIYNLFEINDKCYIKMEKMDGDITNIFLDIIPKMTLNKMNVDENTKENIMKLFKFKFTGSFESIQSVNTDSIILYVYQNQNKIPELLAYENKTQNNEKYFEGYKYYHKHYYLQKNIEDIKNIITFVEGLKIDYHIYDIFMKENILQIKTIYHNIIEAIANINKALNYLGYVYGDNKFDNYAYKIVNYGLTDYKSPYAFKLYDKHFRVFFLDAESGLYERIENFYTVLNNINKMVKEDYKDFSINGQYRLTNYNRPLINNTYADPNKKEKDIYPEDVLNVDENTKKLILSEYKIDI